MSEPIWLRPTSVEEVIALRQAHGEDAVLVAGGTFVMTLRQTGLLAADTYIDLGQVSGLSHLEVADGQLRIGALVTHRAMEQSPVVREFGGSLSRTFGVVASPRIRNQATVGGVLADADYASDPPASLVACGAIARLHGAQGVRDVPVEELILGHYLTCIRPDELLVEVVVPGAPQRSNYQKFRTRSSEDRPCVGVAVAADLRDGCLADLRVVVGAVSDRPQYLRDICEATVGKPLESALIDEVASGYADQISFLDDVRGTATYRRHVTRALIRRGLEGLRS